MRYHIKKWESKLHEIARTNEKAANAIADHAVNVQTEARDILSQVKASIQEAKDAGVSPEKLAPLYTNWIKSLELASELLGDINRAPQINIQLNKQFTELRAVIIGELCTNCRQKVKERLHEIAST